MGSTLAERRMALRLSREDTLIDQSAALNDVGILPSVARVMATADPPADEEPDTPDVPDPETGDDDAEDELDDYVSDFYADALEDA